MNCGKTKVNHHIIKIIGFALLAAIDCGKQAFAQFEQFNHPELVWRTLETEHHVVHFHDGAERTARVLAGIAEEVYEPITTLYDYRPDTKVHWIVRDHDDYSNGGAYYYDNKIVIWATPLDFELRGTHHWLYDVVTHEFTHMIQLGASRKGPRWLPGVYFQYLDYEDERRPDVLYGYPNRLGSWPVAMTVVPMWLAEGTAQYQARGLGHDYWDTHRDMMIRVRALAGTLLSSEEMDVFGKPTLGSELVYCQGYALTRFIAENYGDDAPGRLAAALRSPGVWDFDRASRKALGISERQLYAAWKKSITDDYRSRTAIIRDNLVEGRVVRDEGSGNLYPAFSPDGKRLAFVSNQGKDFLSQGRIVFYDLASGKFTPSEAPASGPFGWSPDGKYLVYARQDGPNRQGSHFDDLYLWDVDKKKEIRLTRDARLASPAFSPDGRRLVAVHNSDGSLNLALIELPESLSGKDVSRDVVHRKLTAFDDGRQVFRPRFAPDGRRIVFAMADLAARDLMQYDLATGRLHPLLASDADERDALYSPDGLWVYYVSDRTGIYNLYRFHIAGGEPEALSNVTGGAFQPSLGAGGQVAYASFGPNGYGIHLFDSTTTVPESAMTYPRRETDRRERDLMPPTTVASAAKPYATPFGKLFILPRIAWDYGRFKPGFYAYTNDFLERLSLFGGAQINGEGDRDLYLAADYRVLAPTLFLEAYNITRHRREHFDDPFVIVGERWEHRGADSIAVPVFGKYAIDYTFNLGEVDVGGRHPLGDDFMLTGALRYSNYKADLRFDDGGTFTYTYMRGTAYLLNLSSDMRTRSAGMDIHPVGGWKGWIEAARENNRFIEGFEIDQDKYTLLEVYKPYNYFRIEGDLDYYWALWRKVVLNPRLMGGWLSDPVDPFFNLYQGGLQGLRGYSYYSLGGTRRAAVRLSLRFPILVGVAQSVGPVHFDRLTGTLFAEAGDAWNRGLTNAELRRDAGAELRLKMFSWYGFPTNLALTAAYGLDRFAVVEGPIRQTYGREWRWYVTLLFDYL